MLQKYSYPIITRSGIINMKGRQAPNQCKQKGHEIYGYTLAILFAHDVKLDENQFIIDHQFLDDAVQKVAINSCETMSKEILSTIEKLLVEKKISFIGIKLEIQPKFVIPENGAYFRECLCYDPRDLTTILAL